MRRWVPIGACLGAVAALWAVPLASAQVAGGPTSTGVSAVGRGPVLPRAAVAIGQLAQAQTLHLSVSLRLPDPGAVTAFIAAVSNRNSPEFGHYLRAGQFGPRFGPSLSSVQAVVAALRSVGLQPGSVASDRLSIPVTATAARIESAFHLSLESYRLPGGQTAFANVGPALLPASAVPLVQGVVGLNDLYPAQPLGIKQQPAVASTGASSPLLQTGGPGPQPCSSAASIASGGAAYTADQLSGHYGMWPLYSLGDFGQGIRVALVEFEPNLPTDIAQYQACYGTHATVNYISVNGGVGTGAGGGEAAADIEDVIGLAPQATIDVYQASQAGNGDYIEYQTIIQANVDQVISTSWGACEAAYSYSALQAEQPLFYQAATQGQTVLAAAGDSGSTGCLNQLASPTSSQLWVDDPASQPYVVGVGGTSLASNGTETVWNDSGFSNGAGGGGLSQHWCMPPYQYQPAIPGLISSYSQTNSQCPAPSYLRQVPDVSASADPQHGYVIYYNGSWNAVFGGTSLAAPLWAAVAPLIDASPFCSGYGAGTPGTLPQGLYSIAASSYYANAFNDVTSGNNDYTPSGYTGGLYPATPGYDMATGLGTPAVMDYSAGTPSYFIPGLAALQCYTYRSTSYADTITSVTPSTGSESTPTSVTIAGTGFLPIAGADMLTVGTTQVAASCSSTTACTAVIPASHVVEKVDLRMTVESLAESAVTSADQFSWTGPYPNPPTNLQAVPGAGQATVSWTPPVYQGTTAITSYTVSGSDLTTNSSITPVAVNGSPPPTQAVISGLTNGDRYSFTAAATNQSGTGAQSAPVDLLAPSQYAPLPPARICDTRPTSESGAPADQCTGHTLGPGSVITVQVTGLGGVPSSATAVVANITVTNTSAPSYLTVWPAGGTRPLASNLNWGAGQTVANLVTVPVSAGGAIQVYNANGQADVVVDVSGYYGPTGLSGATLGFTSLPPARICDTRPTSESGAAADQCTGKTLRPGGTITVLVTGLGGVPSSATAVVANVTVTNTTAASYLTVWPAGGTRPLASNLNWGAGQTRPNRIVIPLSSNGQIELYNAVGQADVVVDVNGYYSSSSPGLYEPINPVRICDTRPTSESGAPADQCTGETLQTGSVLPIQVAGLASVPANAGAMVANVTVTNTGDPSYLTVYPGPTRPLASDLNWVSGDTVPNLVVAGLSGGGLDLFNATGPVDVVVDVEGWFT